MSKINKKNIKEEKKSDSEESDLESEISDIIEDDIDKFDEDDDADAEHDDDDDDYKVLDEIELKKENDNEDEIDCFYDIVEQNEVNNIQNNDVPKEDRITMPFLTKYERVRILGTRAKQISLGAKILVKNVDLTTKTPIEIAKIELNYGIIPFKIRRALPNGKIEEWKLSELIDKINI